MIRKLGVHNKKIMKLLKAIYMQINKDKKKVSLSVQF